MKVRIKSKSRKQGGKEQRVRDMKQILSVKKHPGEENKKMEKVSAFQLTYQKAWKRVLHA